MATSRCRSCAAAMVGRVDAKAHRRDGVFELKSVVLEPGVRVSDRFSGDIAAALVRCARWRGCADMALTAPMPHGFGARLQAALAG